MTKVYPNAPHPAIDATPSILTEAKEEAMTVWRKSLLFNCEGFTVFDGRGDLLFRVDSYSSGRKAEIVLMDAAGKSLFTIRRKRLSLGEKWVIYSGDDAVGPLFTVKKHVTLRHSKGLAHVTPCRAGGNQSSYTIEGSYSHRKCTIYDGMRGAVAEIRRKEAAAAGASLGGDVFRLIVQPGLESPLAMAMVIVLDQMYGP